MDSPDEPATDGRSDDDAAAGDGSRASGEGPVDDAAADGSADAPSDARDDAANRLDRRRVLALTGTVAAGGLAGCGGGDDGDGDDTTTEGTTTTESTTEPTTESTTEATTTEPTTTTATTEPIEDVTDLVQSPSSNIAPTDGFASAEWLLEEDPQIIKVTNLNNEGEGSLRAALQTEGPRIIVFEVGGVIDLESSELPIPYEGDYGKVFVAGQTAPPPGITLIRGELEPYAPNSIIQHIRVRVGDNVGDAFDSISVGSDAGDTIVDHCTTTWSVDENLSVDGGPDTGGYTLSNNLIAEALDDSVHPKGPHSMGSLINNNAPEVAVIGNIYSSNTQRHPRLKGGTTSAVVNNLVYKFNDGTVMGTDSDQPAQSSVVGNRYFTEAGARAEAIIGLHDSAEMGEMYVEDNVSGPGERRLLGQNFTRLDEKPLWPEGLTAMPVDDVQDHNHATAGARPAERTSHDQRILEDSRNMEKEFVDSQEEVGGYPDPESTERTLDVPEYGQAFADWLAQHTRAVELPDAEPPA